MQQNHLKSFIIGYLRFFCSLVFTANLLKEYKWSMIIKKQVWWYLVFLFVLLHNYRFFPANSNISFHKFSHWSPVKWLLVTRYWSISATLDGWTLYRSICVVMPLVKDERILVQRTRFLFVIGLFNVHRNIANYKTKSSSSNENSLVSGSCIS